MMPRLRYEYGEQGYNPAVSNVQNLETGTDVLSIACSILNIMI